MSFITFGALVTRLSRYAGRSGLAETSDEAKNFTLEVLEEYLNSGGEKGGVSKWLVKVSNGYFTMPADLAVPLKIRAGCESGIVHSEWYEFYDFATKEECDCPSDVGLSFQVETNPFPTVFDIPPCGAHVVATMEIPCPLTVKGDDVPHVTIQGTSGGKDVWTVYKDRQIHGERIDLLSDKMVRSATLFDRITQVTISKTTGRKSLWAQFPGADNLQFLSYYDPNQTIGRFKRAKVSGLNGQEVVTILGRVQVRENYSDNDIVPVTNMSAIIRLAKSRQSEENNNLEAAAFSMQRAEKNINDANEYKRTGQDDPFDVIAVTAPSGIQNGNSLRNMLRRRY